MKELDLQPLYSVDVNSPKPIHFLVVLYWFRFMVGNPRVLAQRCSTNGPQLFTGFFFPPTPFTEYSYVITT